MSPWWGLLAVGAAGGWWWLAMRAREVAVVYARHACRRFSVQLLDETVALRRLRPVRGRDGRLHLWRLYHFEFTRTGGERFGGHVALLGQRLMDVHLDAVDDGRSSTRSRLE